MQNVGVDQGCFDIFMAEEFLDGANIVAIFEQVGSEAMPKGVAAYFFRDFGLTGCELDCTLKHAWIKMMAFNLTISGIDCAFFSGKDKLPNPFMVGMGIFTS
jgi:hypothetical protein